MIRTVATLWNVEIADDHRAERCYGLPLRPEHISFSEHNDFKNHNLPQMKASWTLECVQRLQTTTPKKDKPGMVIALLKHFMICFCHFSLIIHQGNCALDPSSAVNGHCFVDKCRQTIILVLVTVITLEGICSMTSASKKLLHSL